MERIHLQQEHPLAAFPTGGRGFFALCRLIGAASALFCLLILAVNCFTVSQAGRLVHTGVYALGIAGALLLLYRFLPGHRLLLAAALVLGFSLRLGLILITDTQPVSDFFYFYEGAQNILAGNAEAYFGNWYFSMWPGTIPVCYWYAGVLSLCNSLLFAKLFNLVLMTGSILLVYLLARHLAAPRAAALAALIYAAAPSVVQTAGQLTNQHPALFFFLLGLWLLLSKKGVPAGILSGLCLALGNCIRNEGIVVYAALFALALLLFRDSRKDRALLCRRGLMLGSLTLTLLLCSGLLTGLVTAHSGHSVKGNSGFQWKLIVGFNNEESGTYSGEDAAEFAATGDGWTIVKRRMGEIDNWPDFLFRKNSAMWGSYEDPHYSFSHLEQHQPVDLGPLHTDVAGLLRRGQDLDKAIYLLILAAFLGGSLSLALKRSGHRPAELLFCLIFCAYFCAYQLIEVGARYRYFILPFLVILGARALQLLPSPKKPENCEKI